MSYTQTIFLEDKYFEKRKRKDRFLKINKAGHGGTLLQASIREDEQEDHPELEASLGLHGEFKAHLKYIT